MSQGMDLKNNKFVDKQTTGYTRYLCCDHFVSTSYCKQNIMQFDVESTAS
jgi:hypothetical protein